jgi:hypothetical protein
MPAMVTLYKTTWGKQFRARLAASGKAPKLIIVQTAEDCIYKTEIEAVIEAVSSSRTLWSFK